MPRISACSLLAPLLLFNTIAASAQIQKLPAKKPAISKSSEARTKNAIHGKVAPAVLSNRDRAVHAINRLSFGERPGDVDRVLAVGVDQWIDLQLNPADIPNQALDSRLSVLHSLTMKPPELIATFPPQQLIRAIADGKKPMPAKTNPIQYGLYEVLVDRNNEQKRNDAAAAAGQPQLDDAAKKLAADKQRADARRFADTLLALPKNQRMAALMQMPVGDRRVLVEGIAGDQRDRLNADFSPMEREVLSAMTNPTGVVINELLQAKLLRAVYSERQLEEVMTDFWFNHFNIFLNKDWDQYYTTSYEREAIRPHALGKFRELLLATAQNPAMLYYLDNWTSIGPTSQAAGGPLRAVNLKPQEKPQDRKGLNENYAREVMELHTLGVDGGYTQADVTELARVLTGWTIQQPDLGGAAIFDPKKHDPGPKTVLGQALAENGQQEGLQMLEVLAHHPSTAKFISTKLALRFVSDTPPETLIKKMSATFLSTDGDIREVLRTMFHSPEFWSTKSYRSKIKTPLEFVASTMRATGSDISSPTPLVQVIARMGMPLYQMVPPTGYTSRSNYWMNSDALVDRLRFAVDLQNNKIGGVRFDPGRVLALSILTRARAIADTTGIDAAVALLEDALIGGEVSKQTSETIRKQLDDPENTQHQFDDPDKPLGIVIALILGSPEFQQR